MIPQATVDDRIHKFPELCKSAGLKVTHQRTAVYAMLAGTDSHPSPEEVYSSIRRDLPSISLATVYKILDLFHKHGFLRRVSTDGQVARYDANVDAHHHLICARCGGIQDVTVHGCDDLQVDVPDGAALQVGSYDIIFHGLCGGCQKSQAPN